MEPSLTLGNDTSTRKAGCLFCRIIQKEIPSNIVYEDADTLAFEDISKQAPIHLLIIPKIHLARLADLKPGDEHMMAHLFTVVHKLAEEKDLLTAGFRTVINSGEAAGQTVFHLHVHLLGGRAFHWPPG